MLEVFGIGIGTMRLTLERHAFCPGDEIRGRLAFELKEATRARAVVVGVRARQRVLQRHRVAQGTSVGYRTDTVWKFSQELAGPDLYTLGEYPFALPLPADVLDGRTQPPGGWLGDVATALSYLASARRFPLQWEVFGRLELPWKIDLSKKVDIVVTARAP